MSGYNQYNQEILNSKSKLYNFSPDVTFLIIDVRNFFGNSFHSAHNISDDERKVLAKEKINDLEKLVQTLLNSLKKDRNVSIEEVIVAEEKVVFKLPKELN